MIVKNINKMINICSAMFLSVLTLQAEVGNSKIEYVEVDKIVNINGRDIEVLRPVRMETKTTSSNDANKNRENDNYVEVDKIVNINGTDIEVLRPVKVQVSTTYNKNREKIAQDKVQKEPEEKAS